MPSFWKCAAVTLALIAPASLARAEARDITGAWSWQEQGEMGVGFSTLLFRPDGGFVKVIRLPPAGTTLRFWGHWTGRPAGPGQVRVEMHFEGMKPLTGCIVTPGFSQHCTPWPHPQDGVNLFTFTPAGTIESEGAVLHRDPQAVLLQAAIPDPSVMVTQAPVTVQPNIQQPVMRPPTRYHTLNDPRKQYEQGNSNFLNGYMRGCVKDQYGRWVGCQQ